MCFAPPSLSPPPLLPTDPVLFASSCGEVGANPPSTTATIRNEAALDLRLTSISAAVEFSKNNNLLGVFLDTYLLVGSL
jgi:CDK inhibitor PHO81